MSDHELLEEAIVVASSYTSEELEEWLADMPDDEQERLRAEIEIFVANVREQWVPVFTEMARCIAMFADTLRSTFIFMENGGKDGT